MERRKGTYVSGKTAEALLLQQRVENGLILGKWADEGSGRGFYILDKITSSQTCSQQPESSLSRLKASLDTESCDMFHLQALLPYLKLFSSHYLARWARSNIALGFLHSCVRATHICFTLPLGPHAVIRYHVIV